MIALGFLAGCRGARLAARVRDALAATSGCEAARIHVPRSRGPVFRPIVCGRFETHICYSEPGVGFRCSPLPTTTGGVASPTPLAPPPRPAPAARPALTPAASPWILRADALYRSLAAPVRECVPPPTRIQLTLELGADGRVEGVAGLEALAPEQQVCVMAVVQGARMPGTLPDDRRLRFGFR